MGGRRGVRFRGKKRQERGTGAGPRLQGRLTVPDNLASIPSHCYTDGSRVLRKAASDAKNTRERERERGNETDKAKQRELSLIHI